MEVDRWAERCERLQDDVSAAIVDLQAAEDARSAQEVQYRRRNYGRCVFAFIEGDLYGRRQTALDVAEQGVFSVAEIAALREETYVLDARGQATVRDRFASVRESVLKRRLSRRSAARPMAWPVAKSRWSSAPSEVGGWARTVLAELLIRRRG